MQKVHSHFRHSVIPIGTLKGVKRVCMTSINIILVGLAVSITDTSK